MSTWSQLSIPRFHVEMVGLKRQQQASHKIPTTIEDKNPARIPDRLPRCQLRREARRSVCLSVCLHLRVSISSVNRVSSLMGACETSPSPPPRSSGSVEQGRQLECDRNEVPVQRHHRLARLVKPALCMLRHKELDRVVVREEVAPRVVFALVQEPPPLLSEVNKALRGHQQGPALGAATPVLSEAY
jgi:hypothetical protein